MTSLAYLHAIPYFIFSLACDKFRPKKKKTKRFVLKEWGKLKGGAFASSKKKVVFTKSWKRKITTNNKNVKKSKCPEGESEPGRKVFKAAGAP